MQEQECRCKERQPQLSPCCRPLTAVSFSSIFPYMLPCARRACTPLPPLSAGDILRACAPASILRSESMILLQASGANLRACTNLPRERIPSTIMRWPERSGRRKRGRGQHDHREDSKPSHSFLFQKKKVCGRRRKTRPHAVSDAVASLILSRAACTADSRFSHRLPRLFSCCLPP